MKLKQRLVWFLFKKALQKKGIRKKNDFIYDPEPLMINDLKDRKERANV